MVPLPQAKRRKANANASFATDQEKLLTTLGQDKPVLSIRLTDAPPDLDISSSDLLDQLIHPIQKSTFLECAFRKKALHITGNTRGRIEGIVEELQQLNPEFIMSETSSDNVFVWLQQKDNGTINSLEIQDPKQALALHQCGGHATYCRAPPAVEQPMVANLLKGTTLGCGQYDPSGESAISLGRGEVEVFLGTKSHTTNWHYDFQENFTIQLSGSKKWKLRQGTVKYPIRACTPHYASPETVESQLKTVPDDFQFGNPDETNSVGQVQEVTLHPGDFLYFPAGMWHHVTTVEQPGVSINTSLMATNYANLTCSALQHVLLQNSEWRETLQGGDNVVEKLQGLLQKLPQIVQDFTDTFGASAIVPPILRHPPSFQVEGHENDWRNVDEEGGGDEGGEEGSEDDDEQLEEEEILQVGEPNQEVLGADVVDVASFEPPSCWKPSMPGPNYHLALNPLGWVRPVKDVTKFYHVEQQFHQEHLYVVNVNYAGNEMHESAVRLVVRDEANPREISEGPVGPREECYLYHGFYCWAKNK